MKKIMILLISLMATMSMNAQTIEVYKNGVLETTYVNTSTDKYKFVVKETEAQDTHEYVDLGLTSRTLWAKTNIGAETETDYGLYFAWGETTGYASDDRSFHWASYKWMASGQSSWEYCTKYTFADGNTDGCWYSNGTYVGTTVDGTTYTNLTELESSDDAATANWGGNWCMPTHAQMEELISGTDCSWTTIDGVSGYKFANKSDASKYIFLPAAGFSDNHSLMGAGSYGSYWSRSLSSGCSGAWLLGFASSGVVAYGSYRFCGQSVRAVRSSAK